jgi:H+/Cl- antiporter ClcA
MQSVKYNEETPLNIQSSVEILTVREKKVNHVFKEAFKNSSIPPSLMVGLVGTLVSAMFVIPATIFDKQQNDTASLVCLSVMISGLFASVFTSFLLAKFEE